MPNTILQKPTSKPYRGAYQGKTSLRAEDIEHIIEGKGYALSEVIASLQSLSVNMNTLTSEIRHIKWGLTIGFALLGILLALFSALK